MNGMNLPEVLPDECWRIDADPSFMEFIKGALFAFGDSCDLIVDTSWPDGELLRTLSAISVESHDAFGGNKRFRIDLAERTSELEKIEFPIPLVSFCNTLFICTSGHLSLMWYDAGDAPIYAPSEINENVISRLAEYWKGPYVRECTTGINGGCSLDGLSESPKTS
jgi:hypothetical protein